jgi:hypothetical protein
MAQKVKNQQKIMAKLAKRVDQLSKERKKIAELTAEIRELQAATKETTAAVAEVTSPEPEATSRDNGRARTAAGDGTATRRRSPRTTGSTTGRSNRRRQTGRG